MDIGGAFVLLVLIGIVVLWSWTGYRAYNQGSSAGLTLYFLHLIAAVATCGFFWLVIVYPQLECKGFLCGLEYILGWLILCIIILYVWPLIIVSLLNKKYPKSKQPRKQNDNVLDDQL